MRQIKFFVLTLVVCFYISNVNAQQVQLAVPDITVHSPNVTGLGLYTAHKVNNATGAGSIEVPLYTIKGSKLELPLTLLYQTSGILVDQEASAVGLGWALNAGGVISRTINDRPDEAGYGFREVGDEIPAYNNIDAEVHTNFLGNSPTLESWNNKDKQPDVFRISTGIINGEFSLDNEGNFIGLEHSSLKYSVDFASKLIIVYDQYGNIYRFGRNLDNTLAVETSDVTISPTFTESSTEIQPTMRNFLPYTSSWHLTEIISFDKSDTIKFRYKSSWYQDSKVSSVVRYKINDPTVFGVTDVIGNNFDGTIRYKMNTSITNTQILDKIIFKNGTVEFFTSDDRLDLKKHTTVSSGTRISGMRVLNKKGQQIKRILFQNNNYFTRNGIGASLDGLSIDDTRKKSLKLNSVDYFNSEDKFENRYSFAYDSTPLPPRNTTSQDFWGYYNGKSNSTLIPETFYTNSHGNPAYLGDNRKANMNFSKAATLNKITYPTGGYSTYTFEPHYYFNLQQASGKTEHPVEFSLYAVNRLSTCDPAFLEGVPMNNEKTFQIANDLVSNIAKVHIMFTDYHVPNGQGMTVKITNLSNNTVYNYESSPSERTQVKVVNVDIPIYAGNSFKIEAKTNGATGSNTSLCNSPYIEVKVRYQYWEQVDSEEIVAEQAGGLRVKEIQSYDSGGALMSKKSYKYEYSENPSNTVGAGKILTEPAKNFYYYPLLYAVSAGSKELKKVLWFTSNSQIPFGYNQGSPVFYDYVTETALGTEGQPNGKTVYNYRLAEAYYEPKTGLKYPYMSLMFPRWKEGLLKSIMYFKYRNGSYENVKSVEYEYIDSPEKRIKTLVIDEFQPDWYAATRDPLYPGSWMYMAPNPNRFSYYNFFVSAGRRLKSKEIVTDYVDGQASLVTEKSFEYNTYFDLKKEVTTSSRQTPVHRKLSYTGDINYTNLKNGNAVSLPIVEEIEVNGKVVNGSLLKYDNYGNITENYIFNSVSSVTPVAYTTIANVPSYYLKDKGFYYYSGNKKISEINIENGPSTSYLWDHFGQYPVAEVRNAVQAGIAYAGFEADGKGNWAYSGATVADGTAPAGRRRYALSGGNMAKSGLTASRKYVLEYWVKGTTHPSVAGSGLTLGAATLLHSKGGWNHYRRTVTGTTSLSLSGSSVVIDEVRLYPAEAQMTSYTYEPLVGMTSSTDPSGRTVYYDYDAALRLSTVRDLEGRLLEAYCYNYAGQQVNCSPVTYSSVAKSGTFTRSNCPSGQTGSQVTYTVPAGTYTSTVSQADADAQAQADVNANGQAYANGNGTCTVAYTTLVLYNNSAGLTGTTTVRLKKGGTTVRTMTFPTGPNASVSFNDIPPDTYSVEIVVSGTSVAKRFRLQGQTLTGTSVTFTNIALSAGQSNTIIAEIP